MTDKISCENTSKMAAPTNNKKYGLIQPKQARTTPLTFVPRPSVFGDDSSSEDEGQGGSSGLDKKAFLRATEQSVQKKQTKLDMQRALEQDPTIYEYDQVYDEIAEKRSETKRAKQDIDRKPKYIASLLAQSERRKREYERRTERIVQKEREAEGEEFKDKEAFVTASYRAKLEEFSKQDEEEEYRDKLEAFADVAKQQDLSGFYRHIYRQTMADTEPTDKTLPEPPVEGLIPPPTESAPAPSEPTPETCGEKRKRQYRPRQQSVGDSDSELSDSSSASSEGSGPPKSLKIEPVASAVQAPSDCKVEEVASVEAPSEVREKSDADEEETVVEEVVAYVKPKVNIWLKRTVGAVFDGALHRYYIRKGVKC